MFASCVYLLTLTRFTLRALTESATAPVKIKMLVLEVRLVHWWSIKIKYCSVMILPERFK